MRIDQFTIPFFIDKVDLDKIKVSDEPTDSIWLSKVPTSFLHEHKIEDETIEHLIEIITRNLGQDLVGPNPRFGKIWRNKYSEHDWQDIHIHPNCQWSFIIYESVNSSKTVFLNPSFKDVQNQLGMTVPGFPLDFRPELKKGDIIIFPSFIEHFVMPGNIGSTISGNIYI